MNLCLKTAVAVSLVALMAGCGSDDGSAPTTRTGTIDLSNDLVGGGLGFGNPTNEVKRYQTFTAGDLPNITMIRVRVTRLGSADTHNDLVAELFLADATSHHPTGDALAEASVAAADLPLIAANPSEVDVLLAYSGLVNGTEYAIVLSQAVPLPANAHFGWVTSGVNENPGSLTGNYFGKLNETGVVTDESRFADGGLQVFVSN